MGDGIAAARIAYRLDAGDQIPHLSGAQLAARLALDLENPHLFDLVGGIVGHEADDVAGTNAAVEDPEVYHGAPERIVVRIEDQTTQRFVGIAARRRQLLHHRFENLIDADPFFGRCQDRSFRVQPQIVRNLLTYPVDIGRGQVDFVDDRDDFQIVFQRQVEVGQGLGLDPLTGVDEQQCPLAGFQGPGDLVGKIDVSRGVDEI